MQLTFQHAEPRGHENHRGAGGERSSIRCQLKPCADSQLLTFICFNCLIFLARDSAA